MTDHMTMIVFLLSQFVCHLLYFPIFPVPVIFKKIVLHPGVRGRYLCPQPKFQNPFFIEYSRLASHMVQWVF